MGWTLKERPKTMRVTRALARQYAEMEPVPHDRPLSERRLAVYQQLLKQGLFRPVTWAAAFCKATGGTYRVNGKHTSTMLSGLEQLPEFYVVVEEYLCDTLEDVVQLYATFDSKMQSRTASDINMSFAGTVPQLAGMHRRFVNTAVSGLSWALLGERCAHSQPAERAELLLEHTDFVLWLHDLFCGGGVTITTSAKHLARQAPTAAIFVTWQKNKADALSFWTAVRDETGEKPDFPDRKLAKYLLNTASDKGMGGRYKVSSRVAVPREMYAKCMHAWNSWRSGEDTDLRYYADKPLPTAR